MADTDVHIRGMYDGAEIKAGAEESEAALEALADSAKVSANEINTALKSVDDGVSSSLGSGGTLDTGTEHASSSLGDFANNAKEEVPGAMLDMQDGVAGAASGIAAALAPMGAGGTVIAGVIAGFVVMKNQADAAAQAMRDKVNSAFSAIEVKAASTNRAIQRMYEQQLTFSKTLEEFGDGDATKGYEKLAGWADALGVETEAVVAVIQGKQTPAANDLRIIMEKQVELMKQGNGTLSEQQQIVASISTAANQEADARKLTNEMSRDNRDLLREVKLEQQGVAGYAEDANQSTKQMYAEMVKARQEAERLGDALGDAASQAARIVFN